MTAEKQAHMSLQNSNNLTTFVTSLLATRLCHDLAGPIGSFTNGMEYLKDSDPDMQAQANELLALSAHEALSRLQFFRQAYGLLPETGQLSLNLLQQLSANYLLHSKTKLQWQLPNTNVDAAPGQILLNLVMIAHKTLMMGGILTVASSTAPFILRATGPRVKWDGEWEKFHHLPAEATQALNSHNVHLYLTASLLTQYHANLTVSRGVDALKTAPNGQPHEYIEFTLDFVHTG